MKIALAAAVAAMVVGAPAMATVWTTDYTYAATFDSGPFQTLSGSFTITSNSADRSNTITALDIVIGDVTFGSSDINAYFQAGIGYGISGIHFNPYINNLSDAAIFSLDFSMNYKNPTQAYYWYNTLSARSSHVTVTQSGPGFGPWRAGVPETSTWAMMLAGFGAIGGAIRRRRTALSAA